MMPRANVCIGMYGVAAATECGIRRCARDVYAVVRCARVPLPAPVTLQCRVAGGERPCLPRRASGL